MTSLSETLNCYGDDGATFKTMSRRNTTVFQSISDNWPSLQNKGRAMTARRGDCDPEPLGTYTDVVQIQNGLKEVLLKERDDENLNHRHWKVPMCPAGVHCPSSLVIDWVKCSKNHRCRATELPSAGVVPCGAGPPAGYPFGEDEACGQVALGHRDGMCFVARRAHEPAIHSQRAESAFRRTARRTLAERMRLASESAPRGGRCTVAPTPSQALPTRLSSPTL